MKVSDILRRITGISTPVFGLSWNPEKSEREVAIRVISFLEDRRVLYNPTMMEVPTHCVESVLKIRNLLTEIIGNLPVKTELSESLRAMRAACRKFLDKMKITDDYYLDFYTKPGNIHSWEFNSAVGELRGVFGVHIAKISVAYGIEVEDDLATILPEEDIG